MTFDYIITNLTNYWYIYLIVLVLGYWWNRFVDFKLISKILNQMARIDKLQIPGKEKKIQIITFIISQASIVLRTKIKLKYGSLEAFVQYVFRKFFK